MPFGNAIVLRGTFHLCSPRVISRGETWAARYARVCDRRASDSARGWRARMCARLINIAIYRPAAVAALMTNWRKCARRPCREYTVLWISSRIGQARHRDKGSVRRLCPVGNLERVSVTRSMSFLLVRSQRTWKSASIIDWVKNFDSRVVFRAQAVLMEKK